MRTKAAYSLQAGRLEIGEVELAEPRSTEVLIRMRAAGVCHSDLHTYKGELRATPPLVIGHEGAGVVESVGSQVQSVQPGDRVMVNWLPACERCPTCLSGRYNLCERLPETTFKAMMLDGTSRLRTLDGTMLKHMVGAATMSEYAVIDEASAVPFPDDVPFEAAAVAGCAAATGVGAVINTARARPGPACRRLSSAAAAWACASSRVAVWPGATLSWPWTWWTASCSSPAKWAPPTPSTREVRTPWSACARSPEAGPSTCSTASARRGPFPRPWRLPVWEALPLSSGCTASRRRSPFLPPPWSCRTSGSWAPSWARSGRRLDLPRLIELYRAGRLQLDELITRRYTLEQLPQAFEDMETGRVARGVIVFASDPGAAGASG